MWAVQKSILESRKANSKEGEEMNVTEIQLEKAIGALVGAERASWRGVTDIKVTALAMIG